MLSRIRALEEWLTECERRPRPWLALLALVMAVQISPLWYPSPDGAAYLSIARSMAGGGPVARFGSADLAYPIGYPLLISPAFWTGSRPFLVLAMTQWLLAVAFMLGVYRWARRQIDEGALWFTWVILVNVNLWMVYRRTLSEMAFLAVLIWAVIVLDDLLTAATTRSRTSATRLLCAVALLALLSTIREVGVLVGFGFALALAIRLLRDASPWRAALAPLVATAAAVLIALVLVRPERITAAGPVVAGHLHGYADAGAAIARSLVARLHLRVTEVGQLLVPGMFSSYGRGWVDINTLVFAPLFAVVAFGWWMRLRRRGDVFTVTAPLFFGAYLLWPYTGGTRYLLPLLPLLLACFWYPLGWMPRWRAFVALAILVHFGVASGQWLIKDLPATQACLAQWDSIDRLAARVAPQDLNNGAAAVPFCSHVLLQLTLDRAVGVHTPEVPLDPKVRWLLTEAAPPPSGFILQAGAGNYSLFHRPPVGAP